jgi:hypothetical protein
MIERIPDEDLLATLAAVRARGDRAQALLRIASYSLIDGLRGERLVGLPFPAESVLNIGPNAALTALLPGYRRLEAEARKRGLEP